MFIRVRKALPGAVLLTMMLTLAACGTPAVISELPPTLPNPPRVAVYSEAASAADAGQPTAVAVQPTATRVPLTETPAPAQPVVQATPTRRQFATATPNVTALPGNAAAGEVLFAQGVAGNPEIPACSTCHNLVDDGTVKLGAVMTGIATRAQSRVPGQDAYTYLKTSIIAPNSFLVPNEPNKVYSAGGVSLMFQDYAAKLTESQIEDLVAYLMTLK
jgi:cytochrome c553